MTSTVTRVFSVAILATAALSFATTGFAAKEKFQRDKIHLSAGAMGVNLVPIGLDGPGGKQSTTTGDDGSFTFDITVDPVLKPAMKLYIGNLASSDRPLVRAKVSIRHLEYPYPSGARSKKVREIVVVGSKVKDVVREADAKVEPPVGHEPKGDPPPVHVEILSLDGTGPDGPTDIDVPHPATYPDSFFDIFFDIDPEAAPDSFFDIFVDVGEDRVYGFVTYVNGERPERPDMPDRPEFPDRPEKPERPDTPTRG